MRSSTLRSLYDLHSWLGIVLGLLLYVVCLSGVAALFHDELTPWVEGNARPHRPAIGETVDRAVDWAIAASGPGDASSGRSFLILLPTRWVRTITVQYRAGRPPAPASAVLDPNVLATASTDSVPTRASEGPNGILTRLHTDLLLPEPVGRYLVGALGVLMLVSIVSGVLLHRKPLSELFTLRLQRSARLQWTDLHKSVGLWSLPFQFAMALTGAVLGFAGFAVLGAALVAFQGDAGAAMAAMGITDAPPAGRPADMLPASALMERAVAALPGFEPEVMIARHYGDADGVVEFLGNRPGSLVYYISVSVQAASGDIARIVDWSVEPAGRRIYAMVTPLHYASYGGVPLKLLYAVLGTGACLLVLSGLRIWQARPTSGSAPGVRLMAPAIVAVTHGLPLAIAALFWLHGPLTATGSTVTAPLFLAIWAGASAWPWLRGPHRAGRELLATAGLLLATMPMVGLLPGAAHGQAWTDATMLAAVLPVLVAESVAFALGGLLLVLALRRR